MTRRSGRSARRTRSPSSASRSTGSLLNTRPAGGGCRDSFFPVISKASAADDVDESA